jgi:uncharacterized membrane protein YkvA (DUF1232 family)
MIKKYLPWLLILLYLISPFDIVPDFVIGLGWLDDLALLAFVILWTTKWKNIYNSRKKTSSYSNEEQEAHGEEENDPYKILGLKRNATKDEIKAAYKRLAAQYHPDKVQHLGKEFQELAHKKFVNIKKACETLIR